MGIFSKSEAYLGVDIGAHGIKLVELHKTKGRPQLWTYGLADQELDINLSVRKEKTAEELLAETGKIVREPVKPDSGKPLTVVEDPRIAQYAKLLRGLCQRAKVTTQKTSASLPVSNVFHAVLTMPQIDKKEIEPIVKAEVQKMLSRPIDELQIVHQVIPELTPGKDKYLRVLVTAAPKQLVQFYTAIFQRAGLVLQELETEAFALERSLVGKDTATVMVVDMGAERTNFFIINSGLPLTQRSISMGGNMIDQILVSELEVDLNVVGQIKQDISRYSGKIKTEAFGSFINPIIKEIEYGFDLFLHQTGNEGKRPEKIILTGGSSVLPFIREEIQKAFSLKVFVGDPWARTIYQDGLKTVLDGLGPRMAVAIGLAMRNIVV